jgi:hydrogenase maturation protease
VTDKPRAGALIIGVGNGFRRDDGVGPLVAERLRAAGFNAVEHSGEGTSLMEAWSGAETVFIVDAALSGAPPGTVHRFDATRDTLPKDLFHYSSHLFAVAEAVEMARILGRLPKLLIVYGIEGETFDFGEGLSPAVERACTQLEKRIIGDLKALPEKESPHGSQ